jgi:hypothetical protein
MHFLINELSFIGQAINKYEADELMKNILDIIQEISVLQNGDPIQTHSSFASQKLSANLTVHEWILTTIKSGKSEQQKIAMILLRLLSKGPFIDLQNLIDDCQCFYQKKCVSSTSLTGATKLQGILISLQNNPDFLQENIEVEFQEYTSSLENRSIKNLTKIKHAKKICSRYKFHSKHHPEHPWEDASPMDLRDEKEAQKVLNSSVEDTSIKDSNGNSSKRYGFNKKTDNYYIFRSDNTFDEQGYPTYHGFIIPEDQVPPKILIKIKR